MLRCPLSEDILGAGISLVVEFVLRIELALGVGSDIDRIFCF